jgi:feruloyl-CoA synthase
MYFNVPKGFEEIANALEVDPLLRKTLFSRVKMFFFAGAGLAQPVWDKLDRVAEQECGERIRMLTGLGMTETAPFAICANAHEVKSGHIGLPAPGIELKLVPLGDKQEVRYRGPNVTPGYWRAPNRRPSASTSRASTAAATPPSRWIRPTRPRLHVRRPHRRGLQAQHRHLRVGRTSGEDHRRRRPLVQDAVIAGINRSDIGVLSFPASMLPRLVELPANAPAHIVLGEPKLRAFFQRPVDVMHPPAAAARPVARALVLAEPPSIDKGEITDKGSINQRAVSSPTAMRDVVRSC